MIIAGVVGVAAILTWGLEVTSIFNLAAASSTKSMATIQVNIIQTIQYNAIQVNTIKYNGIQCNTNNYNTMQY